MIGSLPGIGVSEQEHARMAAAIVRGRAIARDLAVLVPRKPKPICDELRRLERPAHRFQIGVERPVEKRVERIGQRHDQEIQIVAAGNVRAAVAGQLPVRDSSRHLTLSFEFD